jgi:hypothetical protein
VAQTLFSRTASLLRCKRKRALQLDHKVNHTELMLSFRYFANKGFTQSALLVSELASNSKVGSLSAEFHITKSVLKLKYETITEILQLPGLQTVILSTFQNSEDQDLAYYISRRQIRCSSLGQ